MTLTLTALLSDLRREFKFVFLVLIDDINIFILDEVGNLVRNVMYSSLDIPILVISLSMGDFLGWVIFFEGNALVGVSDLEVEVIVDRSGIGNRDLTEVRSVVINI